MTTLAHEPGGGLIVPLDGFLAKHDKLIIELAARLFAAMKRSAILIVRRSLAVSTIALRNSHQTFRRRERAMQRFMRTLQKFSSFHPQVHNHFNQERHLVTVTFTSTDALPHWPSGMFLWLNRSLRLGDLRCPYLSPLL
jgi:hypothetical protein